MTFKMRCHLVWANLKFSYFEVRVETLSMSFQNVTYSHILWVKASLTALSLYKFMVFVKGAGDYSYSKACILRLSEDTLESGAFYGRCVLWSTYTDYENNAICV